MTANDMKNIELLYEVSYRKIDSQNEANRSIDSKVGVLFGFVGVIAVWVMGVALSNKNILGWNIFSIGLFLLMVSIVLCVFAARSRTFHSPIDLRQMYSEKYLKMKHLNLKNQMVADICDSHEKNQKTIKIKSYFFDAAMLSAGMAIVLFLLDLITI